MNVLMIGNSFSICVGSYLPQCTKSVPGNELGLTSLYIGGCSLERHWNNIVELEKDSSFKPYGISDWGYPEGEGPVAKLGISETNVVDMLKFCKWDIVTIQQASHESWDYTKYQPFADNLIAKIKELCPEAEIVIQQTWAYSTADWRISKDSSWGFGQAEMHERLRAAYKKLQDATGFRVIPTGDAVAIVRAKTNSDPAFEPVNSGNAEGTGDTFHLNKKGEYLQACVWFGALFGQCPELISYIPEEMTEDEAKFYRACAKEALSGDFWK